MYWTRYCFQNLPLLESHLACLSINFHTRVRKQGYLLFLLIAHPNNKRKEFRIALAFNISFLINYSRIELDLSEFWHQSYS